MEHTAITININGDDNKLPDLPLLEKKKKKRGGPLNLIRVALFILRGRSTGKSGPIHVDVASKGHWKRLVAAIRLLHHPAIEGVPPAIPKVDDSFHDVHQMPPVSPRGYASSSSSSSCGDDHVSVYASALNLQKLDKSEESGYEEGEDGDEMIDSRAEEFIAHFYDQMRLQRLESMERYNNNASVLRNESL